MKTWTITIAAILFTFLVISCNNKKSELNVDSQFNRIQGKLGDTITLLKGDTVVFTAQNFKIVFDKIVSDSRCPKGVVCFWAGAAEGEFKFLKDSKTDLFNLGSIGHPSVSGIFQINGYTIKLIDFLPYPDINQKNPGVPSAKIIVSQ